MESTEETEIKTSELSFCWVDGYYDGILSGFAVWRERLCYFSICDDSATPRKFTLHSLSDDEAENAVRDNNEFKAINGDHNDLLPDGSFAGGSSSTTWDQVVVAGEAITAAMAAGTYQPPVSYHSNPVIGWFASTKL